MLFIIKINNSGLEILQYEISFLLVFSLASLLVFWSLHLSTPTKSCIKPINLIPKWNRLALIYQSRKGLTEFQNVMVQAGIKPGDDKNTVNGDWCSDSEASHSHK